MENHNEILDAGYLETTYDIEEQRIISLNKFILLSVISLGIYQIWWVYKEWRFFKQKKKSDIMPAARAIFSIFFLTSLFSRILAFAKEKGYDENYSSVALFIGVIIGNLTSRLPEPFWLISIFGFVFFIPPFKALNYAKQNSENFRVTEQTAFSGRQIALIAIGVIFWGLVILGMSNVNI